MFLQFGMLTLRCGHIEERYKTLIFHLCIDDLSVSSATHFEVTQPNVPNEVKIFNAEDTTKRQEHLGDTIALNEEAQVWFLATLTV